MKNQRALDDLCITTIRMLAVDQVEQAGSGHPGMPLGAAPMAYVLFTKIMQHNPRNPTWPGRDRFILSAGHGSALLYALLHLTGYDLSLAELKHFRQYESKTPGHPEYWCAPGVESTTGPLGQGFGMGVGMAIAERYMRERYERDGMSPIDHRVYAIVSDGDLMEGVSSEAASIAGHLKLGKLIYLYDDNHISIEGDTKLAFTEGVPDRFTSYGWHVQTIDDGNDIHAVEQAIVRAQQDARPSIICVRTHIGFGSPKHDQASAHGEPLGEEAMKATREHYGWPQEKTFHVPDAAAEHLKEAATRGEAAEEKWKQRMNEYRAAYTGDAEQLMRELDGRLPAGWNKQMPTFGAGKPQATRSSSGEIINALAAKLENLIGGSADLGPSNKTTIKDGGDFAAESRAARNLHFGVREHAMGTIVNGMALHGGVIPYGGTFLIFSDYMRPSIRIAALTNTHSIFVFTHDSVGLGEDGPTHQPVEHLMSLRAMPNMTVFRPADANETAVGWELAIERRGPFAFSLTRQKIPVLDPALYPVRAGARRGAYVLADSDGAPDLIIIATGSEVHLALEARERLDAGVRVVSMPSWEIFAEQPKDYRDQVLPPQVTKRIAVEARATFGWERWIGTDGIAVGIDRFGASAPGNIALEKLGINQEHLIKAAQRLAGA